MTPDRSLLRGGMRQNRHVPRGVVLLHEDGEILVVDKPPGLLTVGTERERERTLYWAMTDYVKRGVAKSRARLFVVHRLDRDASGLVVFARTVAAKGQLQRHWEEVEKRYVAVVHGEMAEDEGVVENYLAERGVDRVAVTQDSKKGYLSRTQYRVLARGRGRSLVEVHLLTGRKHQIRVHLAYVGHPIVGDRKYGLAGDRGRRLCLHAVALGFRHPRTGAWMCFEGEMPPYFAKLVGMADTAEK